LDHQGLALHSGRYQQQRQNPNPRIKSRQAHQQRQVAQLTILERLQSALKHQEVVQVSKKRRKEIVSREEVKGDAKNGETSRPEEEESKKKKSGAQPSKVKRNAMQ
jgi:hypothetical protein